MREISFKNDVLPLKDKLFRLALRITQNREEAEDMVQDTLMKLWNQREQWSTIQNMESYSLTICRNLSLDLIERKERKNVTLDETVYDRPDNALTQEESLVAQQQMKAIEQLISRLGEKQRTIIQLRDIEGKTYQEIADILQISVSDVKVNLFRARQKLREELKIKS